MEMKQLNELLLQSLEDERGGAKLYEAALDCAQNEELKAELEKYLKETIRKAAESAPPEAAELVACECVVLAETKDHLDWELLGRAASRSCELAASS